MLVFESRSLALFFRPMTHSRQNRPSNHAVNVGTSFFGEVGKYFRS